jgi:molybdate transport system substrate-binding protein
MPKFWLGFAFTLVLIAVPIAGAEAAELQVLAGGGIAVPFREIAALFQSASGHKLVIRFGTTPELIKMATAGGPFDLGVVPRDVMENPAARAKFDAGPMPYVARAGLGVAVRAGAAKPDISTAEALKQTLLKARSVASIPASATGTAVAAAYESLGIAEAMQAKTRAQAAPPQIAEAVAKGEAELAVFLLNVLTDPRLDVVGPFPAEVQREVVYTAGVAAGAAEPEAAKAFLAYMMGPQAAAVLRARGMTPG